MGTVTNNVITKVINAARDELGAMIQIDANTIRIVWNMISSWCGPNEAKHFFNMWEEAIGDQSTIPASYPTGQLGVNDQLPEHSRS